MSAEVAAAQQDSWNEYLKNKEIDKARTSHLLFGSSAARALVDRRSSCLTTPRRSRIRGWLDCGSVAPRLVGPHARRWWEEGGGSGSRRAIARGWPRFVRVAAEAETSGGRERRRRRKVAHRSSEFRPTARAHAQLSTFDTSTTKPRRRPLAEGSKVRFADNETSFLVRRLLCCPLHAHAVLCRRRARPDVRRHGHVTEGLRRRCQDAHRGATRRSDRAHDDVRDDDYHFLLRAVVVVPSSSPRRRPHTVLSSSSPPGCPVSSVLFSRQPPFPLMSASFASLCFPSLLSVSLRLGCAVSFARARDRH